MSDRDDRVSDRDDRDDRVSDRDGGAGVSVAGGPLALADQRAAGRPVPSARSAEVVPARPNFGSGKSSPRVIHSVGELASLAGRA